MEYFETDNLLTCTLYIYNGFSIRMHMANWSKSLVKLQMSNLIQLNNKKIEDRVQRKSFKLQLAIRVSWIKLAFTSPDVISTGPKNFLTSRIDFTVLLLFKFTCSSGKLKTEHTSSIVTWDQALVFFCFENNIRAGKAKR